MAAEDLNSVALVGRLTRDPEVKYTTSGVAKMSLSIAVNRSVKDNGQWKQEASFFDVVFWGKQAEALNQYLFKGKQIGVTGKLEQQRWTTQEGNKSRIIINADSIQLLGGGQENGGGHPQQSKPASGSYDNYSYGNDYPADDYTF